MPKDNEVDEKVIPEGAVAVVSGVWSIMWAGDRSVAHVATKHNLAIGDYLYSPATVADLQAKADAAERRVGEFEAVLRRISTMNAADDSDYGFNEWGEADCFNQVRVLAAEALTGADPT